ncbi:MAG: hypothetical protein AAF959_27990, partial [Cyanobacteria bacterium P01_D01_bin.56]
MVTPPSQSDSTPTTQADVTTADTVTLPETDTPQPQELGVKLDPSRLGQWGYTLGTLAAVYGLLASIDLLAIGFQSILGLQAERLLTLAVNPWLGVFLGIIATALVQSSSVVTTLLVGL